MDFNWLIQLIGPGNTGLASTIVLYSFVIALGVFFGKFKFGSVSLGVTFVLFVGIIMGHFGYIVDHHVLHFVREFGLILFIFAIGLQVGPSFFSSFKKGGMRLNGLALLGISLNVVIVLVIYYLNKDNGTTIQALVGIMSGAVTNTPGLAAAQQAVGDNADAVNTMAMGYAAAYPLGVCGIIGAIILVKTLFRVKIDKEIKAIEEEAESSQSKPNFVSIEVTNQLINGKSLRELHEIIQCDFVISRLMDQQGNIIIPTSATQVRVGDKLYVVLSETDTPRFESFIGPKVEMDWEEVTPNHVVSRRILITKSQYNGVALGSLRLHSAYQLNATRVNRAGVDLLASPSLRLQMGDRITVVGDLNDIDRLANRLGNSMKRLNEPNLITIFVGILFGIIVGSINVGFGMKLGLAGGPLVVAILLSRFGYKFKLITYTSSSASLLMRELGICLFLASVGISSGAGFADTVFNTTGMWWVLWGFLITVLPLIVVGCVARGIYKINFLTIMGLMSGGYTDPPALAYANTASGHDAPAVAYSTVYPLTMFMRVVAAQSLIIALA